MAKQKWLALVVALGLLSILLVPAAPARAQNSRYFPETGKTVAGRFLQYWLDNGGLAQQGYPISDELQEVSAVNGQGYTVQYFERAVFEKHPENAAPYDVLLSLLGSSLYKRNYPTGAPGQQASRDNPRYFAETGHTIGGAFRQYWEQHGGLAQQGLPLSDEFQEQSLTNGKTYTVQYFERAVFEYHPENNPPFNVLLSLLGRFSYGAKSGGGTTNNSTPTGIPAPPTPTGIPAPPTPIVPTSTPVSTAAGMLQFYNSQNGNVQTVEVGKDGTLTPLKLYTNFPAGWDIVVPIGYHLVLFYQRSTGAGLLGRIEDDGEAFVVASGSFYGAGFDSIVSTYDGTWWAYQKDKLIAVTYDANGNTIGNHINQGMVPQWSVITPFDATRILLYDSSSGNAMITHFVDHQNLSSISFLTFAKNWTHIVTTRPGPVVFYNSASGETTSGVFDANGQSTQLVQPYVMSPGYKMVTPVDNFLFFYRSSDFSGEIDLVNPNGNVGRVNSFTDLGNWTSVIGIK